MTTDGLARDGLAVADPWAGDGPPAARPPATLADALDRIAHLEARLAERATALARAELQLAAGERRPGYAQKLERVGQLAAGVAHELNTPIQFIGDSSHFLGVVVDDLLRLVDGHRALREACLAHPGLPAELVAPAEALRALEDEVDLPFVRTEGPAAVVRTLEGARRVSSIVAALRQFAHPGHGVLEPTDLNQVVETTLVVAANEYKYVADLERDLADLPLVTADAGDLGQVVLNLVVNASHAIADRGDGPRGTITVRTAQAGDEVLLQVSDTGTGIDPTIGGRVFDPFFTTKEPGRGTGQGLSIISTIVRRHGGRVGFTSELGRGTCFTVHLPIGGPR